MRPPNAAASTESKVSLILILTNKSALAPTSDYNYEVLIGDGTVERSKTLARGEIKRHVRADGWKVLVRRVISEAE